MLMLMTKDENNSDLFDSENIFNQRSSLQEGLLVSHQGEEKKNKVVPRRQALRHSLRLFGKKAFAHFL